MRTLLPTLMLVCACAAQKPAEKMSSEEAFGATPATTAEGNPGAAGAARPNSPGGTPKQWAKQFPRDLECEHAAAEMIPVYGRDAAWTHLKACVANGNFMQLKVLCDNWTEELLKRPEAGGVIAQVIGTRGGHVKTDLALVQARRIPLFELSAALKQPVAFKGRYLIFVGKISEVKQTKGRSELLLAEKSVASELSRVMVGPGSVSTTHSTGSGSAAWRSNGVVGSGSAQGSYAGTSTTQYGKTETRVTDVLEETGQEVIAKLSKPDPFLSVDRDQMFLVRFDGTAVGDTENVSEGETPPVTALVTLISYHDL